VEEGRFNLELKRMQHISFPVENLILGKFIVSCVLQYLAHPDGDYILELGTEQDRHEADLVQFLLLDSDDSPSALGFEVAVHERY